MALVGDMILQTANAPGTGTFNLIAAPPGRSSFMLQAGAGQVYYFAEDASSWEKGIGTVVAGSPDTLSRDTILGNSFGTTARINFPGALTIICDIPADRSFWANAQEVWDARNRPIGALAAGNVGTDAARLDQVGLVSAGVFASGNNQPIVLPLSATDDLFRIDLRNVVPATPAALYLRVSNDGGNTFLAGSNEYQCFVQFSSGSSVLTYSATASYAQISQNLPYYPAAGYIEFDPVVRMFSGNVSSQNSISSFVGYWATVGAPTHILIGAINANLQQGQAKLSRRGFSA